MRHLGIVVLVALLVWGCRTPDDPIFEEEQESTVVEEQSSGDVEVILELGDPLNNPYKEDAMVNALISLHDEGILREVGTNDIPANFYYARFLPANDEELRELEGISNLDLYEYPLDREIIVKGTYYQDPAIPEGQITWQYCVYPIGQQIPQQIRKEILGQLFLNDQDIGPRPNITDGQYLEIERRSHELTNNEWEGRLPGENERVASNWTPSGNIQAHDDLLGTEPLKGVKVRARRWFKTATGITNSAGNYTVNKSFNSGNKVNYSIVWERDGNFDIRSGTWGQAIYNGPKKSSAWNLTISSGVQKFYAAIHRAAHYYYYEHIFSLRRPNHRVKIGGYDKCQNFNGDFANWRTWLTWPDIRVYRKEDDCTIKGTDEIFSTTAHEIAHSSHWQMSKSNGNRYDFLSADDMVVESWARCVQWLLTNNFYLSNGLSLNWSDGYQWLNATNTSHLDHMRDGYTPVAIDLIDDVNQRINFSTWNLSCSSGSLTSTSLGTGCWIGTPPSGTSAFVFPNPSGAFYHTPVGTNSCPGPAWYDGANCYLQDIPSTSYGWVHNNRWILEPSGNGTRYARDWAKDYTPRQIEDALLGERTLANWRDAIINDYNNASEMYVTELFNWYINL